MSFLFSDRSSASVVPRGVSALCRLTQVPSLVHSLPCLRSLLRLGISFAVFLLWGVDYALLWSSCSTRGGFSLRFLLPSGWVVCPSGFAVVPTLVSPLSRIRVSTLFVRFSCGVSLCASLDLLSVSPCSVCFSAAICRCPSLHLSMFLSSSYLPVRLTFCSDTL